MTFDHDRQITALLNVYQAAEQNLMRRVEQAVASGQLGTAAFRRQQLAQVQALLIQLQASTVPQAVALLQASYQTGLKIAGVAGVEGAFGAIHTDAVNVLADSLSTRLGQGFSNIGRQAEDVFRKEGLRLAAQNLVEGQTRLEASAGMTEALVQQGVSTFVDKAGRDWGLGRYTSMVLRTTTREAVSVGTKNRLIEGGIDLVTWDATGESCPICDPLDGVTYSLTGETPGYEVLEDMPPIHPNCECVLTPADVTFQELEEALGLQPEPPAPEITTPPSPSTPPALPSLPSSPAQSVTGMDSVDDAYATAVNTSADEVQNFLNVPEPPKALKVQKLRGVNGLYTHAGAEKGTIQLEKRLSPGQAATTYVHEYGHHLDMTVIGRSHPARKELLAVLKDSPSIKELQEIKRTIAGRFRNQSMRRQAHKYVDYLLLDHEIIARAFTQYMAFRHPRQLEGWIEDRDAGLEGLANPERYWSDEDFAPIAKAFDKWFKETGVK